MSRILRYGPFSRPEARRDAVPVHDSEEIPPIEQFADELPPIEDFLLTEPGVVESPVAGAASVEELPAERPVPEAPSADQEGWAAGSWQSYDWGSLSPLARGTGEQDPAGVWGEAEWPLADEGEPATRDETTAAADEIAAALEGMARRIRSGELVIDGLEGTPPEAAMAAALATLLRMRG